MEVNKQTISYKDISSIVRKLWEEVGEPYGREFCIMGGDWQTFTRMFDLKLKEPEVYKYLIPFPGEWHWNWHILKGIFVVWGEYILKPFAISVLRFKNFDLKCKNFHYAEHLFEVFTVGVAQFMISIRKKHPEMSDMDIQSHYRENSHIYELLYMWNWYICPYWHTRSALKAGNSEVINTMWRYWLPLFITAKKHNYAIMSIRFVWMLEYLHPDIVGIMNDFRIFSFSTAKMTGIPLDGVNELVC